MPHEYQEKSKATISVKLSVLDDKVPVEVALKLLGKNETSFALKGEASGGIASVPWDVPALDAREENRLYAGSAWVAGKADQGKIPFNLKVFPAAIEVIAKDALGAPVKHAKFTVYLNREPWRTDETNDHGTAVVPIEPGPVTVSFESKFGVKWLRRARVWEAELKEGTAKLVWPAKGTHKQYVNMTKDLNLRLPAPSRLDERQLGSTIKVQAKLDPPAPAGKIYVRCAFGATNSERTDPARRVTDPNWPPGMGTYNFSLDVGQHPAGKDYVELSVELGAAGRDVLTIDVSAKDDVHKGAAGQERVTITNWRKAYYDITTPEVDAADAKFPRALPKPVAEDVVVPELSEVGIELEKFKERRLSIDELRAIHPGIVVKGDRLDKDRKTRSAVVLDADSDALLDKLIDDVLKEPGMGELGCHILLVDDFFKHRAANPFTKTFKSHDALKKELFTFAPAGLWLFRESLADGKESLELAWQLSDLADLKARFSNHPYLTQHAHKAALSKGEWSKLAWKPLYKPGVQGFMVAPADTEPPFQFIGEKGPATWPIEIRVKANLAERIGANGTNYGTLIILKLHSDKPPNPRAVAKLLMHELGHALQQAVVPESRVKGCSLGHLGGRRLEPAVEQAERKKVEEEQARCCVDPLPGLKEHPLSYVGRGHEGAHCAAGAGVVGADGKLGPAPTYWDEATNKASALVGTCIMFGAQDHRVEPAAPPTYCEDCRRFLKATKLDRVRAFIQDKK